MRTLKALSAGEMIGDFAVEDEVIESLERRHKIGLRGASLTAGVNHAMGAVRLRENTGSLTAYGREIDPGGLMPGFGHHQFSFKKIFDLEAREHTNVV